MFKIETISNENDLLLNERLDEIIIKRDGSYQDTFEILELIKRVNLFTCFSFVIIGLIGHFLTIFVFAQKRFRKNSANVYLLFLALNDSYYLFLYFFEETIKNYQHLYPSIRLNKYISYFNILDRSIEACILINYLRYVLRFVSSYTIVAFSLQRLSLVYSWFSLAYCFFYNVSITFV